MQVILTQDMDDLGLEGSIVDVAKGYGRNYLVPQGFALVATRENITALGMQRKKIEMKRVKIRQEAEAFKAKMDGTVLTFMQKAGAEGKLYGSVTTMDIASALEEKGIVVDRHKIVLEKQVKELGEFDVAVKIYPGVVGTIKIVVAAEKEAEA
ncbi:MAG TPA: 50S ribosomal protein L9 [Deltaproteobacteria bacterium]|nr:50S ribosomal protein L9 [Deltaproteobacteria bacterium]HIJ36069.1 50S ribosomal protein L9 [Deltaproteobacteria bacterium]HIJ41017.1 50S ribosomal protein L9 [Deltaproteobacteria bacterium]